MDRQSHQDGAELKSSYFRQAVKNVAMAEAGFKDTVETLDLFAAVESESMD